MRAALGLTLWLLVAGLAAPAAAHNFGTTAHAAVTVSGQTVRYALTLVLETPPIGGREVEAALQLDRLAETVGDTVTIVADGRACAPVPERVVPPSRDRAAVEVVVLYACGTTARELVIRDGMNDLLGPGHHTIATIEWPGGREQLVFETDRREGRIALAPGTASADANTAGQATAGFAAYLVIGVEHILLGFDHVLFVIALILQGGSMLSLLAIVTAFTVAHSITLALSVLGIASLPGQIVEPVIALSIAYVAAENLFRRDRAVSRRWAVGFLFGLVHGFGFAGALREVGLPADGLALALLGFNLGVEAGQALIVAALLPVLWWIGRLGWQNRAVQVSSAAIMAVGVVLLVERALLGGA